MSEATIERRLKRQIEALGAKVIKFTPQGIAGMPDRIILAPGGRVYFVELKDLNRPLRPLQQKRFDELRALGFNVRRIDRVEQITELIREMGL